MSKRDKIVLALCFVAVFSFGVITVKAYESEKAQALQQTLAVEARQFEQDQARKLAVANEEAKIKAECEKGLVAYNALPPKEKAIKEAPNCDIQLLQ